jgi:hypothetical protein
MRSSSAHEHIDAAHAQVQGPAVLESSGCVKVVDHAQRATTFAEFISKRRREMVEATRVGGAPKDDAVAEGGTEPHPTATDATQVPTPALRTPLHSRPGSTESHTLSISSALMRDSSTSLPPSRSASRPPSAAEPWGVVINRNEAGLSQHLTSLVECVPMKAAASAEADKGLSPPASFQATIATASYWPRAGSAPVKAGKQSVAASTQSHRSRSGLLKVL